jgi:hypothetical protein
MRRILARLVDRLRGVRCGACYERTRYPWDHSLVNHPDAMPTMRRAR